MSTQQRLTPLLRVAWLSSRWSVSTLHKPTTPTSTVTTLWRHGARSNKTHRDCTGQKYSHALLELSTSFSSNFLFWGLMWRHVYSWKPRILEWLMSDVVYRHRCVMVFTSARHGSLPKAVEWLVLLLRIRKVAGLNPEMAYHEWSFFLSRISATNAW